MKIKQLESIIKELQTRLLLADHTIVALEACLKARTDLQVIMNRWNDESRELDVLHGR